MNYYLPCKLCGHNNEASSEYLTFCENCKKKLTINFREWQKGNPEGSVIDFHKNECIPEDDISFPSESELKKKSDSFFSTSTHLKIILRSAVVLVVLGLIYMAISNLNRSVDQFQSISLNWEEVVYGDYGLSLELPIKLEEFELRVPIQQASLVKEIQAYNSDPKAEISAMVITTLFDKSIGSVNVQASISGFIAQIQKMPGISQFKVQQGETTLSGIVGFEQKGSFLISGQAKVFRSIGVSKGLILWQVMVVCNEDNEVLLEAMDRIFNSIEILYNTGV